MPSNTVADLELALSGKGYHWIKTYDQEKGICVVKATRDIGGSTIVSKNSSRSSLWSAYKRALELTLEQLNDYEKAAGKTF